MHILVLVYFKAGHGGLHDNVMDSVEHILAAGHRATVVCKSGRLAETLTEMGAGVVETDYEPTSFSKVFEELVALHKRDSFTVVHSHPFSSRKLGAWFAKKYSLPFVVTFHGKYLDALDTYIDDVNAVFCVSEGIKQFLVNELGGAYAEKFFVVSNVPSFSALSASSKPNYSVLNAAESPLKISLVSRFDKDKQFIIDLYYQALAHTALNYPGRVVWTLVGDGGLLEEVKVKSRSIAGESVKLDFVGWKTGEGLRDAYTQSGLVIAPGRCVLESMSCGVPTIAVGSKGYVGLISPKNWRSGVYSNFGGIGKNHEDYEMGLIEKDVDTALGSASMREKLGSFGRRLVDLFYQPGKVHSDYLNLLHMAVCEGSTNASCSYLSPPLELEIKSIEIGVSGRKIRIQVVVEGSLDIQWAWYIYRDADLVEKGAYSKHPELIYLADVDGHYVFRCFAKSASSRINFVAAELPILKSEI